MFKWFKKKIDWSCCMCGAESTTFECDVFTNEPQYYCDKCYDTLTKCREYQRKDEVKKENTCYYCPKESWWFADIKNKDGKKYCIGHYYDVMRDKKPEESKMEKENTCYYCDKEAWWVPHVKNPDNRKYCKPHYYDWRIRQDSKQYYSNLILSKETEESKMTKEFHHGDAKTKQRRRSV